MTPFEEVEKRIMESDLPVVRVSPPEPKTKNWYIWEKILSNIHKVNPTLYRVEAVTITWNDWVGSIDYYKFDRPVILPDWVDVQFYHCDHTQETIPGRDGYTYIKYSPG